MSTLSKFAHARLVRRIAVFPMAAAAAFLAGAGCQHSVRNLATLPYEPQIEGADGVLFESNRRYVAVQRIDSPLDGIIDSDSFVAYLSLPLDARRGARFDDPGIGVAWSDASLLFSDMFSPKSAMGEAVPWEAPPDDDAAAEARRLLELSLERSTVYDHSILRDLDPNRGLQILDYASLVGPGRLAPSNTNPDNRSTD